MPGTEIKLHIKKIIMPAIQLRIDWKIKIYIITTFFGAIIGLLILFPLNQVVLFHEYIQYETNGPTAIQFVQDQFIKLFHGESLGKIIFYSSIVYNMKLMVQPQFNSFKISSLNYFMEKV